MHFLILIGFACFLAMPESSKWPDIRRWGELQNNEDDFNEEYEEHLEAAVVVHNELYISESESPDRGV